MNKTGNYEETDKISSESDKEPLITELDEIEKEILNIFIGDGK